MTLNNLALLLSDTGRGAEAESLFQRALQTFTSRLDDHHPKVRGCAENLAGLLRELGRDSDARALESRFGL
jgi:hypothetical protein